MTRNTSNKHYLEIGDNSGLDASLLICTRERVGVLALCLAALAQTMREAQIQNVTSELILIDNGSQDETRTVLDAWAERQDFAVIVSTEPVAGLARARNAGMRLARGAVIIMTDDDCLPASDFLRSALTAFSSDAVPTLRGGRIELGDPDDLPVTIKTDPAAATLTRRIRLGGFIMGANFAFHREVFELLGPFDERFGAGAPFIAGEDTDYVVRALEKNIPVKYEPKMMVRHFHGRRTEAELVKLLSGYSFSDGAVFAKFFFQSNYIRKMIVRSMYKGFKEYIFYQNNPNLLIQRSYFSLRHQTRGFFSYVRSSIAQYRR